MKKIIGFSEDSKPIVFDVDALLKNKRNIAYLYGQLKDTHSKPPIITPPSSSINYLGNRWTTNSRYFTRIFTYWICSENV